MRKFLYVFFRYFVIQLNINVFSLNSSFFLSFQLMTRELLDLLISLLQKNDEIIQELTMNIILAMLLDENVCPHIPTEILNKLREILPNLHKTENHFLSNNISSALERISS